MLAIEELQSEVASYIDGSHDTISPGLPFRIPDSWGEGDPGAQGDLVFVIMEKPPEGYCEIRKPKDVDRQLVPGNTQGAKHCLDSLDGVRLFRHTNWNQQYDGLDGPWIECREERVVNHPTHGPWTIPAGRCIKFEYPRVHDFEQQRERRNAD